MTDKKQIGDDEEKWTIFETLLDMWDSDKLIEYVQSEYMRGHEDGYLTGYEAARADILADLETVAKRTKVLMPPADRKPLAITSMEPVTADKPELDRFAAEPITHGQDHKPLKPVVAGRSETDQSAETTVAGAREAPEATQPAPEPEKRTTAAPNPGKRPSRDIRGHTGTDRPKGLPTTFEMIGAVLDESPGLTAIQVGDKIRDRWWPGMDFKRIGPEFSTWITKGRLIRDPEGKLTLSESGRKIAFPAAVSPQKQDEPAEAITARESVPQRSHAPLAGQPQPMRREVVTPGAKLGPPARKQNEAEFEYLGRKVLLRSREYMIAVKLRAAIGKGHLSPQFLAETALGADKRNAIDNKSLLSELCDGMNERLATVGLNISYYEGFGFVMKEI